MHYRLILLLLYYYITIIIIYNISPVSSSSGSTLPPIPETPSQILNERCAQCARTHVHTGVPYIPTNIQRLYMYSTTLARKTMRSRIYKIIIILKTCMLDWDRKRLTPALVSRA